MSKSGRLEDCLMNCKYHPLQSHTVSSADIICRDRIKTRHRMVYLNLISMIYEADRPSRECIKSSPGSPWWNQISNISVPKLLLSLHSVRWIPSYISIWCSSRENCRNGCGHKNCPFWPSKGFDPIFRKCQNLENSIR